MGDVWAWVAGVGGFALGAAGVSALAVVDWAAWVLVLPGRRPGAVGGQCAFATDPGSPERRLGEPIEAVAADGVRLAGIWHAADGPTVDGRGRVLLMIHGFAEDPSALQARMGSLNRRGWDVAALDARAHGRSGGDRGSFGGREAADVVAWIDALTGSGKLAGGSVVAAWGRSMGAAIAVRAASENPRIRALVLEAPYLDLEVTFRSILRRKRVPLPGLLSGLILRRARGLAGVSLTRPSPIELAPRVDIPAMVVHGRDDSLIPVSDARRLAGSFSRPASFVEVPGAGHNTVVEVGGSDLLGRIADFLDDAAGVSGPG